MERLSCTSTFAKARREVMSPLLWLHCSAAAGENVHQKTRCLLSPLILICNELNFMTKTTEKTCKKSAAELEPLLFFFETL